MEGAGPRQVPASFILHLGFLRQGLLLSLEFTNLANLTCQRAPRVSASLPPPQEGDYREAPSYLACLSGFWGLNSVLKVLVAGCELTEPSPPPSLPVVHSAGYFNLSTFFYSSASKGV